MNRPPQKADSWFASHQASCDGKFVKISEPDKPENKKRATITSMKHTGKKMKVQNENLEVHQPALNEYFKKLPNGRVLGHQKAHEIIIISSDDEVLNSDCKLTSSK